MDNKEFFEAVKLLSKDTGVTVDAMCQSIQAVMVGALKKEYNNKDIVFCDVDPEKGEFKVYLRKTVVSEISDPDTDLLVEQAQQYKKGAVAGDIIEIPVETAQVSRITAEKGKHMLRQAIREAEQGQLRSELESHNQEIITVTVQRVNPDTGDVIVSLGKTEAVLYKSEQLPDEELKPNDIIKVYVAGVRSTDKNTRATISRTHPGLVRRLFEEEVPEIFDGTVEIKAVAREAGSRTKMAVYSADADVDPVGACIGPRGARVGKIVDLLGGEKIDIVKYSDVPEEFIAAALAPADVVDVTVESEEEKVCRVRVPDGQLSLAIGNKGQNARLAAKLTGWKIDIKPESGIEEPVINFDI
ncbi:MAG: transcription termination factor NusA [Acutalibacteraceae bacterium]